MYSAFNFLYNIFIICNINQCYKIVMWVPNVILFFSLILKKEKQVNFCPFDVRQNPLEGRNSRIHANSCSSL